MPCVLLCIYSMSGDAPVSSAVCGASGDHYASRLPIRSRPAVKTGDWRLENIVSSFFFFSTTLWEEHSLLTCPQQSFIMVVYDIFFLSSDRIFCPKHNKKILLDNHYKTLYESVRSEYSCCRVSFLYAQVRRLTTSLCAGGSCSSNRGI